jgi:hypothetical protein
VNGRAPQGVTFKQASHLSAHFKELMRQGNEQRTMKGVPCAAEGTAELRRTSTTTMPVAAGLPPPSNRGPPPGASVPASFVGTPYVDAPQYSLPPSQRPRLLPSIAPLVGRPPPPMVDPQMTDLLSRRAPALVAGARLQAPKRKRAPMRCTTCKHRRTGHFALYHKTGKGCVGQTGGGCSVPIDKHLNDRDVCDKCDAPECDR